MTDFEHYVTFCHVVNMLDEALIQDLAFGGVSKKCGEVLTKFLITPTQNLIYTPQISE